VFDVWLATNHDCINGAHQKGKVYWSKVVQEYEERKCHKSYEMRSECTEESIEKIWYYIKQETTKFYVVIDHVVAHPKSGTSVVKVVRNGHHHSIYVGIIIPSMFLAYHKPNL
jgi:hypothetical protein